MIDRLAVYSSEVTADNYFSIRLQGQSGNQVIGTAGKSCVGRPVGIQTHKVSARLPIERRETPSNHELSIGLERDAKDIPTEAWAERRIQGSACFKTCKETLAAAGYIVKVAAHENSPVRLNCQAVNLSVGSGIEVEIKEAIRIHPREIASRLAAQDGKRPRQNDIPIRLESYRVNRAICPWCKGVSRLRIAG